jgi:hypothetical protein
VVETTSAVANLALSGCGPDVRFGLHGRTGIGATTSLDATKTQTNSVLAERVPGGERDVKPAFRAGCGPSPRGALKISRVTASGCDTIDTCDAITCSIRAFPSLGYESLPCRRDGWRHCPVAAPPRLGGGVAAGACSPVDLGSAETTNRRESLCLNAYLMNHWSQSSIRVCLVGVASTVGCRAEMTTSSPWRPSVTEWPQAWRITRLTTCRPPQTLRRREFPKRSIWRSEGCWATPQSIRRSADSAVLRFRRCDGNVHLRERVMAAAEPGFGVAVSRVRGR